MKKEVYLDNEEEFVQKYRGNPSVGEEDHYVQRLFVWLPHKKKQDNDEFKGAGEIGK